MDRIERVRQLKKLINQRILVVDGAMGTSIQNLNLTDIDFGGLDYEGCNENLSITKPEAIKSIHRMFLEAGADIVETNSFGSTPLVLDEYHLGKEAFAISEASAKIAREVADKFATEEKPRFVAGSMGPTTKAISVTGGVTWDDLAEHYRIQVTGLIEGGVDFLLLETSQDILNVKAGLEGIDRAFAETSIELPIAVQCTIETMGTTLGGQDIEAFYTSLAHRDLLWIGMNCATGPQFMRDHLRTLAQISRFPVTAIPNAGLPDEDGNYNETPAMLANTMAFYIDQGWVNVIGGCCGTIPEHIKQLVKIADNKKPRLLVDRRYTTVSGLEPFTIDEDTRPVIIGERTNVLGSRKFKNLIADGKIEEASEIGRQQVRKGAHIIDVCLQDPDRDEVEDMIEFLGMLTKKIKVPIMIDSTDSNVIEEALKRTPGKSIINSVNLEDGEERFKVVIPLARRFGAALIVGCIDDDKEQAQAITRERKLEIAQRSYNILTEKYGVQPEDIIFDPLVFPVGTGDKNYIGAGVETIEGVRLIKKELPECKTILGISNVSFGLPPAGREVLNSVMLYHAVQAGLDGAIVNSERLIRYGSIPEQERKLAEDLIWWKGADPIGDFANHFRERRVQTTGIDRKSIPINQRIANCIIEGTKEGLMEDLDDLLNTMKPLEIINGPLMEGMDEVGRLFGRNELIVAEVLQSAEAMKAAVTQLEPHMDIDDTGGRGKILLATVKGDVHDIGKNLVEIILSNNGYKVINLGIKVPPQDLIEAYIKHKPDIIGLSGLLVKSAQMMVDTVKDFNDAGVDIPVLVGGAALTNRFTRLRISPEYQGMVVYAKDAMNGLDLAGILVKGDEREKLAQELILETQQLKKDQLVKEKTRKDTIKGKLSRMIVRQLDKSSVPPDLKLHVIKGYNLAEVFTYINPVMLFNRHLGFKGKFEEALRNGDLKALKLQENVKEAEDIIFSSSYISANGVYKFFRAASEGDDIVILDSEGLKVLERFRFGRQSSGDGFCLSDYLFDRNSGKPDYIGMFVTTIGPNVRTLANKLKSEGNYLASHIVQALALEGAEAFAELLHQKIRYMWGIGDLEGITKKDMFQTRYQGRRYSFGYPACPRLEDQGQLWNLLEPDQHINVDLTDGFMMDPEGSVSALVLHHPEAKYFNLSSEDIKRLELKLNSKKSSS